MRISKIKVIIIFLIVLTGCSDTDEDFSGYAWGDFVYLSSVTAEKVNKLLVKKGEQVKAGQLLMETDSYRANNALSVAKKNYQAELASLSNLQTGERAEELDVIRSQLLRAKSAAGFAQKQLARYRPLYQQKTVSQAEWEELQDSYAQKKAEVEELEHQLSAKKLPARQAQIHAQELRTQAAKLQLDKAQWDLEQTLIIAPQDALVYDILYRPGERVAAGKPLISLLPSERVKVRFFIPERQMGAFHVGMKVKLYCDGCPQPVGALISYISPQAEYTPPVIYSSKSREKLMFMAEASPADNRAILIKPGQPVRVALSNE